MDEVHHRDPAAALCIGAARALWPVLLARSGADTVWVRAGRAACWVVIFLLLPNPCGSTCSARTDPCLWVCSSAAGQKMKVTSKGGHVVISKDQLHHRPSRVFLPAVRRHRHRPVRASAICSGTGTPISSGSTCCSVRHYAFHVTLTFHVLQTQNRHHQPRLPVLGVVIFSREYLRLLYRHPPAHPPPGKSSRSRLWCNETGKVFIWLHHLF